MMPPSPQKENGYTPIANEIMEALMRVNLSPAETRVLWFLFRKTYGWNKKSDRIPLSQFSQATGIERRNVHRALKKLSSKQMIAIVQTDDRMAATYRFQKDYSRWKLSSKQTTPPRTVVQTDDKTVVQIDTLKRKERKKTEDCSEVPRTTEPTSPVFLKIPIVGQKNGNEYPVTEDQVGEWQELFPGIDVRQSLRNIKAWNLSNPKRRKHLSGIERHITSWLASDQNKRGGIIPQGKPPEDPNRRMF
jgi:phage replication O-like protein O